MQRIEQLRIIHQLLNHLENDTTVDAGTIATNPVAAYTDEHRARQEWDILFRRTPQIIGLSGDLPNPHSFFTHVELDLPLLCVRDGHGTFRAFLNVCRHRSTIVEIASRGTRQRFTCPFHAWSYDSSGALTGVPKEAHFGAVDRSCRGLVELPSAERHGLLVIHADRSATIDADLYAGLDGELASWGLGRAAHVTTVTYEHAANWKLAVDTFGETYHFNSLHRETLAPEYHGNVQTYDTYGPHHRMVLCLRAIDRCRTQPEQDWEILRVTTPVYYLFPNTQLLMTLGGPVLAQIYPDGPNPHHSRTRLSFYTNPDLDTTDLDPQTRQRTADLERRMTRFAEVIRDEDYATATASHQGARATTGTNVIYGRNEPALHHYHNTYHQALGLQPLPTE